MPPARITAPATFGPEVVRATARTTEQRVRAFDGARLLERARAAGRRGTALLESAGVEPGRPHRTIAVVRPWLRVELRGGRPRLVALVGEAEQLVGRLQPDLDAIVEQTPVGRDDAARLSSPSVLDALRRCAGSVVDRERGADFPPGLFGALSYELVDRFERLPARRPDPFDDPDASFVLAGDVVVFEHDSKRVQVVTRGLPWEQACAVRERHDENLLLLEAADAEPPAAPSPGSAATPVEPAISDVDDAVFLQQVAAFRDAIGAGEIFQGVLSRGLTMRSPARPLDVYRHLRARNPSPYMFCLELADGELLGASPETFLRVERGTVEIRPIAGTVARGFGADGAFDPDLDARLGLSLLLDPKELAEHAMLLDLARNDVARVAEPGTTRVVEQLAVEKYSHVQHLVSRVRGQLKGGLDALHAYRAAANMGTLTGAPKVRAMELIRATEANARGFYGGAAGYLLQDGRFDSCIVIRSLRHRNGIYHTRAGAGIVWHSRPESELRETEHKSLACRAAVAAAAAAAAPAGRKVP